MDRATLSLAPFLIAAIASASPIAAQVWSQLSPSVSPPARYNGAAAYDTARDRVVLFGGDPGTGSFLSDTWEWDGTDWMQQMPAVRPGSRFAHAMTYDAGRERVVLFGGGFDLAGTSGFDDTWEWDGARWVELHPVHAPAARLGHDLAYDAARRRVVLFGGRLGNNGYSDTWEWDGADWTPRTVAGPPARCCHSMAYDPSRHAVIMFGGWLSLTFFGDTWELDDGGWTLRSPANVPTPRWGHKMAYDAARGRVVSFGGYTSGSGYSSETFEWNGSTWLPVSPPLSPSGRIGHVLVYERAKHRLLLWGGGAPSRSDTWVYGLRDEAATDETTASFVTYGTGCAGSDGTVPVLDHTGLPVLGQDFSVDIVHARADSTALLLLGFHATTLDLAIGAPCSLLVVPAQQFPLPTDAAGNASFVVSVPNSSGFSGVPIFCQYAVPDAASALGYVTTRAGMGVLGR